MSVEALPVSYDAEGIEFSELGDIKARELEDFEPA
jgi:hypothetical protein